MTECRILVSACLLGTPCRYDGASKPHPAVMALARHASLIPVCPECAGGLATPRPPAEIRPDGRVVTCEGTDVSAAYARGAEEALRLARAHHCCCAVLKARSPACGCRETYDGSFSRRLVPVPGVAARALMAPGSPVYDEEHLPEPAGQGKTFTPKCP